MWEIDWNTVINNAIYDTLAEVKIILLSPGMIEIYKGLLISGIVSGVIVAVVKGISTIYYIVTGHSERVAKRKGKRNAAVVDNAMNLCDLLNNKEK